MGEAVILTHDELLARFDEWAAKLRDTLRRKGADYAQAAAGSDPFSCFIACESIELCSAETVFLWEILKKLMRLKTMAQVGKLECESGADACEDLAGYAFLLQAYTETKQAAKS